MLHINVQSMNALNFVDTCTNKQLSHHFVCVKLDFPTISCNYICSIKNKLQIQRIMAFYFFIQLHQLVYELIIVGWLDILSYEICIKKCHCSIST